jgi:hypothetical protein
MIIILGPRSSMHASCRAAMSENRSRSGTSSVQYSLPTKEGIIEQNPTYFPYPAGGWSSSIDSWCLLILHFVSKYRSCLVPTKNQNVFKIPHHIESCGICENKN